MGLTLRDLLNAEEWFHRNIHTKNDALLNMKHHNPIIRSMCAEKIKKDKVTEHLGYWEG